MILIELPNMNFVAWHFENLEYLNIINIHYLELLSNVTERGLAKFNPTVVMDLRLGRSKYIQIKLYPYYFALPMSMIHHYIYQTMQLGRDK